MIVGDRAVSPAPPPVPVTSGAESRPVGTAADRVSNGSKSVARQTELRFSDADAVSQHAHAIRARAAEPDQLLTYLDGKLVAGGRMSYEHTSLEPRARCSPLMSVIGDPRGNEKIRSEPLVFHIKQPSTNAQLHRSSGPR